jgi:hypothetical protein
MNIGACIQSAVLDSQPTVRKDNPIQKYVGFYWAWPNFIQLKSNEF